MRFFFKNSAKKNGILLLETEGACLCRPISWGMAAMLGNSAVAVAVAVAVVVVVVGVRAHEQYR